MTQTISHGIPIISLPVPSTTNTVGISNGICPIARLKTPAFEKFEEICDELPALLKEGKLRARVNELPFFDCKLLQDEFEWQRAVVVLTMISQGYVHGNPPEKPVMVLPDNIAKGWLAVAEHFKFEPVLNYAATVQYNWHVKANGTGINILDLQLEDLEITSTVTGTPTEVWFYQVSLGIELESVRIFPAIKNIACILNAAEQECRATTRADTKQKIIQELENLFDALKRIAALLDRLSDKCDPAVFFNHVRLYLSGWDLPCFREAGGLRFGSSPDAPIFNCTGGSAAQSPMIQAVDSLFGIRHPDKPDGSKNYLYEIRKAMPETDRNFILWVEKWGDGFKKFCLANGIVDPVLRCINQIIVNRRLHAGVVWRYIKAQAMKLTKPTEATGTGGTSYELFLTSIIASTKCALDDFEQQAAALGVRC